MLIVLKTLLGVPDTMVNGLMLSVIITLLVITQEHHILLVVQVVLLPALPIRVARKPLVVKLSVVLVVPINIATVVLVLLVLIHAPLVNVVLLQAQLVQPSILIVDLVLLVRLVVQTVCETYYQYSNNFTNFYFFCEQFVPLLLQLVIQPLNVLLLVEIVELGQQLIVLQ